MTKIKYIALLICFAVSPAFGQYGGANYISFLNNTDLQMQIRFKSPQGSYYDNVQSIVNGRTQEFEVLPGWRAIAEYPGTYHPPSELNVHDGVSFTATIRDNQPTITSVSKPPVNPEPPAREGIKLVRIKNDAELGLRLKMSGPGVQGSRPTYIAPGKSMKFRLQPGWSVEGIFDNGITLPIVDIKDQFTYRFFQSGPNAYRMTGQPDDSVQPRPRPTPSPVPTPTPQRSLEEKITDTIGLTVRPGGAGRVEVLSVRHGSIAQQLRIQRGDTIKDLQLVSAVGPWGQPENGFQVNGFTIETNGGFDLKINLQATGKAFTVQ